MANRSYIFFVAALILVFIALRAWSDPVSGNIFITLLYHSATLALVGFLLLKATILVAKLASYTPKSKALWIFTPLWIVATIAAAYAKLTLDDNLNRQYCQKSGCYFTQDER